MIRALCLALLLFMTYPAFLAAQDADEGGTPPAPAAVSEDDAKLFKKAERYFFQRKFEMAEILLQEVIRKNPENAEAYAYLGDIMLQKKRYDGALNLYTRALDLKPDQGETLFRMGQVYYYKKMGAPAIEYFNRAIEKDPSLKFAYFHLGLTYLMLQRDKAGTINSWERYLALAPEDPQYENIRRVIELLKDPNFVLPPPGSEITIEEALLLGGETLKREERKAPDKQAGHETKKTTDRVEEIYNEDDL